MLFSIRFAVVLAALASGVMTLTLTGCDSQQTVIENPVTKTPVTRLRETLKGYVQSGELDSGVESLPDLVDEAAAAGLPANDATALKADAERLKTARGGQIKTIAQEMIDQLPPS